MQPKVKAEKDRWRMGLMQQVRKEEARRIEAREREEKEDREACSEDGGRQSKQAVPGMHK